MLKSGQSTQLIQAETRRSDGGGLRLMGEGQVAHHQSKDQARISRRPGALFTLVAGQIRCSVFRRHVDAQAEFVGTAHAEGEPRLDHSGWKVGRWISGLGLRGRLASRCSTCCKSLAPVLRCAWSLSPEQDPQAASEQGPWPKAKPWPGGALGNRKRHDIASSDQRITALLQCSGSGDVLASRGVRVFALSVDLTAPLAPLVAATASFMNRNGFSEERDPCQIPTDQHP